MSVESDEKHNVFTLDMKLDIIDWFGNGQSKTIISRVLSHIKSVLLLIPNLINTWNKEMHQHLSVCSALRSVFVEMEYLLITWLEDVIKNGCQFLPTT
jgi:hypothetical protein